MRIYRLRTLVHVLFIALLAIGITGCSRLEAANDYVLSHGQTVPGNLVVVSGNVTLDSGSQVMGSVLMLCCNLIVRGEVDGNVVMLTGNIDVDPQATIRGMVKDYAGDVQGTGPVGN